MTETTIGPVEMLEEAPTVVTVDGGRYVLSTDTNGKPILFSAVCPHQSGRVGVVDGSTLRCPNHRWEFDAATGEAVDRDDSLEVYDVTVTDGSLAATLDA